MKQTLIGFFSNLLSVILGIVITFAVQGKIDRRQDRRDVASALDLVHTELSANMADIATMSDYLREESAAAAYFLERRDSRAAFLRDSVDYYSGIIMADASISVSTDALELLKSSSLFQKIGDNDLSMKIIRAYDTCGAIVDNMNRHLTERTGRFEKSVDARTAGQYASRGSIDILEFMKSPYGVYALQCVANQADPDEYNDVSDVKAALEAIEEFIR